MQRDSHPIPRLPAAEATQLDALRDVYCRAAGDLPDLRGPTLFDNASLHLPADASLISEPLLI